MGDLLAIHQYNEILVTKPKDILYCLAEGNYTKLYLNNGLKVTISKPLGIVQKVLEPYDFIRIHKSHLVNSHKIIVYQNGSNNTVTMSNGEELMVSKNKRILLFDKFKIL